MLRWSFAKEIISSFFFCFPRRGIRPNRSLFRSQVVSKWWKPSNLCTAWIRWALCEKINPTIKKIWTVFCKDVERRNGTTQDRITLRTKGKIQIHPKTRRTLYNFTNWLDLRFFLVFQGALNIFNNFTVGIVFDFHNGIRTAIWNSNGTFFLFPTGGMSVHISPGRNKYAWSICKTRDRCFSYWHLFFFIIIISPHSVCTSTVILPLPWCSCL